MREFKDKNKVKNWLRYEFLCVLSSISLLWLKQRGNDNG